MEKPMNLSQFQLKYLTGDKPLLNLDDEFLKNYMKVLLRSEASEKIWEVKLDGNRLAGGWDEFSTVHMFREGDVLVFKHEGDENFHVSVSSLSRGVEVVVIESDDDDDESDEEEEDDDDDDDSDNILVKKSKKQEAESSSSSRRTCYLEARVTPYSIQKDRLDLARYFKVVSYDEHKKPFKIDLENKKGRKWTLTLSRNRTSGVFYISTGWIKFCSANKLRTHDLCKFKLFENGKRPSLLLCAKESSNEKQPFLKLKLTSSRLKTGSLYVSSVFLSNHGIKESSDVMLLNKDGRKWESHLQMTGGNRRSGLFYMRNGWREMCKANKVKVNDSFVLELVWEDSTPVFKFCSKIEGDGTRNRGITPVSHGEERRAVMKKRGRPPVSKKPATITFRTLQCKKPRTCSVSDKVARVKQGIIETINTMKQFRVELKTKEKNLEASLKEVDTLGERILGISQML